MSAPALAVSGLDVRFATPRGEVHAVRGIEWSVEAGQTLAIVGESGCGKSVSMMALAGLLPRHGTRIDGSVRLQGEEILGAGEHALARVRGARLAMIFQDPMSALNPTMRIGEQIAEPLVVHRGMGAADARREAVALLERLRVDAPAQRARQYPCEFSGGMLQRAMIAMAIACRPAVLLADEPTTALDATVQKEVLDLLAAIRREDGMALVLVTHDLGVVAHVADRVAVMYAGEIVEQASASALFAAPAHPYTRALLDTIPHGTRHARGALPLIEGSPPDLLFPPAGCGFAPRCAQAMRVCARRPPPLLAPDAARTARCWLRHPDAARATGDRA